MLDTLADIAFWNALGAIIWINLLLSGDNAVVIALAARALPKRQRRLAVFWGSVAAIAMRILLALFAVALLQLPWLKLAGGALLLWVGVQLLVPDDGAETVDGNDSLLQAIKAILVADLVMSLDNVIAVAAVAEQGPVQAKTVLLVLGLVLSIPIVIFGSAALLKVVERYPVVITLGGALLGYIAGDLMAADAAIRDWVAGNAAWLVDGKAAGAGGALLVVGVGLWLARRAAAGQRNRPNS
jgi:YjbE family integral membrane protein